MDTIQGMFFDSKTQRKVERFLAKEANKPTAKEQREIKDLQRKALSLWKARVKVLAGGKCEACGKTKRLQAHHIESYSVNKALRYDIHNGLSLCPTCHKFGRFSAHRSFIFMYLLLKTRRLEDLDYLTEHYRDKTEITKEFLQQAIENFMPMKKYYKPPKGKKRGQE